MKDMTSEYIICKGKEIRLNRIWMKEELEWASEEW